jgi:tRNA-(ms[2]io[6]A)-hydroxylase
MLSLVVPSDPGWARAALLDLDRILVDHAHCEMKAASNAMSMAARHGSDMVLVRALTELAQEELTHFAQVLALLERRGLTLGTPNVDSYAAELRHAHSRLGRGILGPLVDRLLVGALIEARSCERFKLLAAALTAPEETELQQFYVELVASEARHYRTYVDLAIHAAHGDEGSVHLRLARLGELEGAIVEGLVRGSERATIHG